MSAKKRRDDLIARIQGDFQRTSGQSAMLSQVIADKVGISSSDLECMGLLEQDGAMTAGRLAELTGLTSGAITRMIDRLESAKYVRRRGDPNDRRRVVVELNPARQREFERFYGPLASDSQALLQAYSEDELEVVARVLAQMVELGRTQTERIQALAATPKRRRLSVDRKILGQNVRVEI